MTDDGERLLTLDEAAKILDPSGENLNVRSLRTEIANGRLKVVKVAGRFSLRGIVFASSSRPQPIALVKATSSLATSMTTTRQKHHRTAMRPADQIKADAPLESYG